jgi:ADP-ribose pyrophosphatase
MKFNSNMTKSTKNLIEKTIESQQLFCGNFIKVMRDTIELPNGKSATREYITHSGATCIIALTNNNDIILEYQYRHPVGKIMLELPAGKLEAQESPLDCAKRELKEETGYTANNWIALGTCLPCIGYSTEKIIYFLATELTKGDPNPDDGEFLETISMPLKEFMDMIYNGDISDSKTLSGMMLYLGHINKNK